MISALQDIPGVEHDDLIRRADGVQPAGDDQQGAVAEGCGECPLHGLVVDRVERRSHLVEQDATSEVAPQQALDRLCATRTGSSRRTVCGNRTW